MCGICGFYDKEGMDPRSEPLLAAMGETLRHRGPDASGSALRGRVGLHSRRLSIIDRAGGDQPIWSSDGRLVVVFNGEIFNFQELRRELEQKGHRLRTQSDTEVLLYLYRELGIDAMLPRLNGFFAFALYDLDRGRLLLARDRVGVKPLYYAQTRRGLLFGSELKALLEEGSLERTVDPTALLDFLCLRYVPAPRTIWKDARKLPAGHYLTFDGTHLAVRRWWDLPPMGTYRGTPEAAAEELWALVEDAVRLRLVAEVPLGAFLSGGLDSSGVVTAMHRFQGEGLRAVSIGFEGWDQSELEHARRVANHLGIQHITDVLRPEVLRLVDELAYFFDEPFADPSAIPTYLLAKRTRREVTVALSGDGGDECFAGYRRYRFDRLEHRVRQLLPGPLFRSLFRSLGKHYPGGTAVPPWLRARTTLQNLGGDPLRAYLRSVSCRSVEEARALLHPDLRNGLLDYDPVELFRPWYRDAPAGDPLARAIAVDFHTWLPEYVLCKSDRATMAWGLEARSPLLDFRIVEFAARLPSHWKLHGAEGKWLLKKAFAPHLPPDTLARRKQGFAPPLKQWVDQDLAARLEQLPALSFLDGAALRQALHAHQSGAADHAELFYQLLVLAAFESRWLKEPRGLLPVGGR